MINKKRFKTYDKSDFSDCENPNNPLSLNWYFVIWDNNPPSVDPNLNPRVSTGRERISKRNKPNENSK